MHSTAPETRQRLNTAFWLLLPPVAVLLTLAIGWSIFWYVKSRQTAAAMTAWMTHEAQLGRAWSCPGEKIGGFPFSVTVSCENLHFQGGLLGKTLTGTLRGMHATAPLLRTANVVAKLEPPLAAKSSDGTFDAAIQWSELYVELDVEPGVLERAAFGGTQVRVQGQAGGTNVVDAAFGDVNSFVSLAPERHDQAYDFMFSFNEGSIPALNSFLDTQVPVSAQLAGTISQVNIGGRATLGDILENWRVANGHADLSSAWLTSGRISLDAKGGLDLDGQHRPEGKFDAGFAGLDKAFRQLGIDPALLSAGQVLSGLLGGKSGGTGRLNLPVALSEGFLSIGPLRTPVQIPPLY